MLGDENDREKKGSRPLKRGERAKDWKNIRILGEGEEKTFQFPLLTFPKGADDPLDHYLGNSATLKKKKKRGEV